LIDRPEGLFHFFFSGDSQHGTTLAQLLEIAKRADGALSVRRACTEASGEVSLGLEWIFSGKTPIYSP
jgi:hypothetical protein